MTAQTGYITAFFKRLVRDGGGGLAAADFAALPANMLEIALAVHAEGQGGAARWARLEKEFKSANLTPLLEQVINADPEADLSILRNGAGWKAFDLADVMTEELPPVEWLVRPFVQRPSVTAWFGKPKSLKSLLVLDMCLHVAGGQAWLSNPQGGDGLQVNPARVVWLDLENGAATLKRRMKAIARALGHEQQRGQVLAYSMPNPWPDLSQTENAAALINLLAGLGDVGILVIDHLGQALGAIDENSPLISQVMGNIRNIAESCNLAVALIHHAKKGQGKDGGAPEDQLRGHGAILANVDAAYLIERDRVDRSNVKLIPVAVRGPDAPNVSVQFSYEQDSNLELSEARFWRMTWQSNFSKARDTILQVLADGKRNQTELIAAVKLLKRELSDKNIRDAIAALESTREIIFTAGNKGAKIYRLAEGGDDEK
jgi:hypothetical protein